MMPYGLEYPFGQFGSAVLAVSPPSFTCYPNFFAGVAAQKAEKALALPSSCIAVKSMYPPVVKKSSLDKPRLDKYPQTMLAV